jgi:hypothetical protein
VTLTFQGAGTSTRHARRCRPAGDRERAACTYINVHAPQNSQRVLRISCNTKGRVLEQAGAEAENRRIETLIEAAEQVETLAPDGEGVVEVVGEKGYHSNQVMVEPTRLGARSARLMSTCYRDAGATAYSRLGAFCQVPELTSRRSDTASIRFSSESHPDLKSAHVTLTCVAPRAFSRSSVRLSGNRFISSWNSV